jgi:hypothetical protein
MAKKKKRTDPTLQAWIDARKRHRLSDAHVQMARELGLNPRKLGGLDNHDQEPWKSALPAFLERLYRKSFGRDRPEVVRSIEETIRHAAANKAEKREAKLARRAARAAGLQPEGGPVSETVPPTTPTTPDVPDAPDGPEVPAESPGE